MWRTLFTADRRSSARRPAPSTRPVVEQLEARTLLSVTTSFNATAGLLRVTGDGANDPIRITSDQAGNVRVNGRAFAGVRLATTRSIEVNAGGGNDTINLGGLFGYGGAVRLDGQAGNDVITGSPVRDTIFGRAGNDSLYGGDGDDWLEGNDGGDFLKSDDGHDTLYGGVGRDYLDGGGDYDVLHDPDLATMANGEHVWATTLDSGYPQNDGWSCGPNSATRFLRHYGYNVTYEQMKDLADDATTFIDINMPWPIPNISVSLTDLGLGVPPPALANTIRGFRPETSLETGTSFDRILEVLGQGQPVIALIKVGNKKILTEGVPLLHYVTLNGYDLATQRIYYTDTDGGSYATSFAQFNQQWNWSDGGATGVALRGAGVHTRTIIY